jgi:16S rRNA (guanine966-N2)-methyltransferase
VRVIGGVAGGRRLKAPDSIRPTSDLVRGAIFDVIEARHIDLGRVLDLYAGSGALGIEALSRGAEWCDFVERGEAAAACIRENLAATGLSVRAAVHRFAAARAPERLKEAYAIILADPPYEDAGALGVLERVASSHLLAPEGHLVFEHSSRESAPETLGPARVRWGRRYGDAYVSMYSRSEEKDS